MRKIIIFFSVLLITVSSYAQTDWQSLLKEDAVKIVGNKMVMEEYDLLSGVDETGEVVNYQMYIYSEVPNTGFISRDNFVSFTTMIFVPIILEMGLTPSSLEEPIGDVDFELKLFMTSQGVQIQFNNKNDGTSTKNTVKWTDMFAK